MGLDAVGVEIMTERTGMVPLGRSSGIAGLYRALAERKTVRAFDRSTPMRSEDLGALLYWVFGCHGHTKMTKGVPILRRTSPSGGSLHPVEVYPLVQDVAAGSRDGKRRPWRWAWRPARTSPLRPTSCC